MPADRGHGCIETTPEGRINLNLHPGHFQIFLRSCNFDPLLLAEDHSDPTISINDLLACEFIIRHQHVRELRVAQLQQLVATSAPLMLMELR